MNRREALATLTAMPGLARIEKADLKPTDVIVVELELSYPADYLELMRKQLKEVWPDNKVVILTEGARLKVVSGA